MLLSELITKLENVSNEFNINNLSEDCYLLNDEKFITNISIKNDFFNNKKIIYFESKQYEGAKTLEEVIACLKTILASDTDLPVMLDEDHEVKGVKAIENVYDDLNGNFSRKVEIILED